MSEIDWFNVGRDLTYEKTAPKAVRDIMITLYGQHPPDVVGGPGKVSHFDAIPQSAVDPMTDIVVGLVAELVQGYIDAGSERDVTMEDDKLREGIRQHFQAWVVPPEQRAALEAPQPDGAA